ncbi:MAG: hypothetical protein V7603_638 [Micromonosporaceae bacterium]
MPPTGSILAADLSVLLAVGRIDLPQMAYVYTRLNRDVAGTAAGDVDAFGGGYAPKGMGGTGGQVYQAWSQLRNELQDALGHTAQGIREAGDAIVSIVHTYADSDTSARDSLRDAWLNGPPANLVIPHDETLPAAPPSVILSA